ncbi:EsV-1-149 [Ectocarpus siliculosus virus 1]|uniref:EsV-1-149 n=1 Tax=Ectocarpus siliculosus virus 1 (isolate New Zealand/Kaikoura/1988) TaxID=654926 RepID=Q8QND3_ESV1K|nr:EsV-1-149 [Ectocarpus siliculosus virus 1]AAK14564.1 EsV-1-149 [Ectocarpus siliculosus virus 1]
MRSSCCFFNRRFMLTRGPSINIWLHATYFSQEFVVSSGTSKPTPGVLTTMPRLLPKDTLQHILSFVKEDSFAIIGSVCRDFRNCYGSGERVTRTSKYTQSLRLFQQATAKNIEFKSLGLLDDLISRDEIDVIPSLLARGYEWDHFCVQRAAETNNYKFFQWLQTTDDLPWLVENAHRAAAKEGNLEMMIYLVDSGAGFPDSGSRAVTNDCKIVEWLRELQLDPAHAFVRAAREDDVCVFEQTESFDDHGLNRACVREACVHGAFNVLEFFRVFVDVGPTVSDVAAALHFQTVDILDWCREFFPCLVEELSGMRLRLRSAL